MTQICHVCNEQLEYDGQISLDRFYLRALGLVERVGGYNRLGADGKQFVDAVTWQYYRQFPQEYGRRYEGIVSIGAVLQDSQIDRMANKHRLLKITESPITEKYLGLLVHRACFDGNGCHNVDLSRIKTAEQALDWLFHLGEKAWFHPLGFIMILEELFPESRGKAQSFYVGGD
ncbi:MAG: hypothetical protein ABIB47_06260 [Candidatus Woesearchaeota archaeon]